MILVGEARRGRGVKGEKGLLLFLSRQVREQQLRDRVKGKETILQMLILQIN